MPQRDRALLAAAGLAPPAELTLISLPTLNGLRASEATGTDIEAPSVGRGHRTLATCKGREEGHDHARPTHRRAIDLATGKHCEGPVFLAPAGARLDRRGAGRIVRRVARRAGITKNVGPHTPRHEFITAHLLPACRCATCRKLPRIPAPGSR